MTVAPDPAEIFERSAEEGRRRLDQSMLELVSTSFIAGFTIVFGIVALGVVEALVHPVSPEIAKLAGALAFGPGLVFLVVGRAELFNENFFDPIAAAIDEDDSWMLGSLGRLWLVTFALNLVGGLLFVAVLSVEGALPQGAPEALLRFAEEAAARTPTAEFIRAFVGGALVVLLSFLLEAVNSVGSRIALAYVVGVLLALGPFDHVIVSVLHLAFGVFLGDVSIAGLLETTVIVTAGNVVGGIGLVTLTHVGQAIGARES